MKQKSLLNNVVYNFLYTGLNLFFPLITSPYISRVLGAANIGKVNFSTSIVNWFILFASFGVSTYGVREIAKNRDDKEKMSKIFSELLSINAFLSFFVTIIYVFSVFQVSTFKQEIHLHLIFTLSIFFNMLSLDWFYQGVEEYRYITIRSAIMKVISLVSIFLFITKSDDYVVYGLISILATGFSGVLNFIHSKNFISFTFKNINPLKHLRKLSVFFVHTFVVSLYTSLDQPLLGFLEGPTAVAYIYRSRVVTNMAVSISTSISNATLPRASYYMKNNKAKFDSLILVIPNYILWITVPMTLGIIILAPNIMLLLGGLEFMGANLILMIISPTIIFSPLSAYLQNQILIPTGNEKLGLNTAIVSGVVSVALNFTLIPMWGIIGAGVSVVVAEFLAVSIRYVIIKRSLKINVNLFTPSTLKIVFSGIIMFVICMLVYSRINGLVLSLVVTSAVGALTYILTLVIFKEKTTKAILKIIIGIIQNILN